VPQITHFYSCIYVLGCKLSLVRLCDSDFGITPVVDITIGVTCAAFCFHIAHIIIIIIIVIKGDQNMYEIYIENVINSE
jgi:hypothetical protein